MTAEKRRLVVAELRERSQHLEIDCIGSIAAAARVCPGSIYVFNMMVMLDLAVGVDYTLLVLQRY